MENKETKSTFHITKQHVQGLIVGFLIVLFLLAALILTPASREWLVGFAATNGDFDTTQLNGSISESEVMTTGDGKYQYVIVHETTMPYDEIPSKERYYVSIVKYLGDETDAVIPETLSNYPVASIGVDAFSRNEKIVTVTLPKTIDKIEMWAFWRCTKLETVKHQDTIKWIESNAFSTCIKLKNFLFGSSLESIGMYAFEDCKSLKKPSLPDCVKYDDTSFKGCIE